MAIQAILNGTKLNYSNGVGNIVQQFLVGPMPDVLYSDPGAMFNLAVGTSGMSYTAPHPTVAGLYVSDLSAWCTVSSNPASVGKWFVTLQVTFSTPSSVPLGGILVELSGSNSQFILNRWPNGLQKGQPILVGYSPPDSGGDLAGATSFVPQIAPKDVPGLEGEPFEATFDTAEIPIEAPNAILQFTRTEFAFPAQNYQLRRSINSKSWLGFDAGTVMFRDLVAIEMFGFGTVAPNHWICKYIFEVAPDSTWWEHIEFFKDEHTGKIVPGVDILSGNNNGYTKILPYDSNDFGILKFPPNLLFGAGSNFGGLIPGNG